MDYETKSEKQWNGGAIPQQSEIDKAYVRHTLCVQSAKTPQGTHAIKGGNYMPNLKRNTSYQNDALSAAKGKQT